MVGARFVEQQQEKCIEVDHVIPRLFGGSNDIANLDAWCDEYNRGEVEQRQHALLRSRE